MSTSGSPLVSRTMPLCVRVLVTMTPAEWIEVAYEDNMYGDDMECG